MTDTTQPWAAEIVEPARPPDPTKPPPASSGVLSKENGAQVLPENSWEDAMKQVGPNAGVS
jgi:hypothetical protein